MAATAAPIGSPLFHVTDPSTNLPLVHGKVHTYAVGTTTPKATYADLGKAATNTNPVILDSNGDAPIFFDGSYKIIVNRADDTLVYEIDGVSPGGGTVIGSAIAIATNRTALKALDTVVQKVAFLKQANREGNFVWKVGDYSTQIAADTDEFYYIKADAIASNAGAWVRTGAGGLLTGAYQDTSAVISDPTKHWYPSYYSNAAVGIVHKLNRLMVGEATLGSTDVPMTTPDWLEMLVTNATALAQLISVSSTGNLGVVGAARTQDYRAWTGLSSGGSQGVSGFAQNNDTTPATTPIAAAGAFSVFHEATVNGISEGVETTAASKATPAVITPYSGVSSGSTMALNVTSGFAGYTHNISVGIHLGISVTAKMLAGISIDSDVLDVTYGAGGNGVAIQMARGQSIRWQNSGLTWDAEMWGAASGLNVNAPLDLSAAAAGQVKFPASPNLSSDTNTIDAYAEVAWTPVLTFATPGDLAVTYSAQVGTLTRVGRLVTAFFQVTTSAFTFTTASGNLQLTGLPLANVASPIRMGTLSFAGITKVGYTQFSSRLGASASAINFQAAGSALGVSSVVAADVPSAGTVTLIGSIQFEV